jgi:fumarylacetoacetate (FAA) hydrolase
MTSACAISAPPNWRRALASINASRLRRFRRSVTPDELGAAWQEAKVHLPLLARLNGEAFGRVEAGIDMTFDFGQLIAHCTKTRALAAGTIIGSGTVSNRGEDGSPGKPIDQGGRGYSCIAEIRMVETIQAGAPTTSFLKKGDRVEIEMRDGAGQSIFGRIDQIVR